VRRPNENLATVIPVSALLGLIPEEPGSMQILTVSGDRVVGMIARRGNAPDPFIITIGDP